MPIRTTVKVEGLRQLGLNLKKLEDNVARKAARSATAAAATVVKKAAKANIRKAPSVDTGSLLDAVITKRAPRGETELTSEHLVTVRGRGKKRPYSAKGKRIATAPHAHLVEFGTVNMPAEPFMRPAFDSEKNRAADVIADRLRAAVTKAGT
jgi:HK97 gp10 family phage protein